MNVLHTAAILITLAALFSYITHRFLHLPTTIGIMLISLMMSLGLIVTHLLGLSDLEVHAESIVRNIDFYDTLMQGMLSFLLFAGALHVNLNDLINHRFVVFMLATISVVLSTFLVGSLSWLILSLLEINLPFTYCLVFGALISPTDPIAVIGILKSVGAPKDLETQIAGESLFNDGIGIVIFLITLGVATGDQSASMQHVLMLLLREAGGGVVFGLVAGSVTFYMIRSIDSYQIEVLLTLALVMGGYAAATAVHVSGPIAMVVAGLLIGNHGRLYAMSATTRDHLDDFWELVDEVLNAVLFVLIGLEILLLPLETSYLLAALLCIPAVLSARFISVGIPVVLLRHFQDFSPKVIRILTWGGLRGGISVALVLSLPEGRERDIMLTITYAVVVFSILVQGLTLGPVVASASTNTEPVRAVPGE